MKYFYLDGRGSALMKEFFIN